MIVAAAVSALLAGRATRRARALRVDAAGRVAEDAVALPLRVGIGAQTRGGTTAATGAGAGQGATAIGEAVLTGRAGGAWLARVVASVLLRPPPAAPAPLRVIDATAAPERIVGARSLPIAVARNQHGPEDGAGKEPHHPPPGWPSGKGTHQRIEPYAVHQRRSPPRTPGSPHSIAYQRWLGTQPAHGSGRRCPAARVHCSGPTCAWPSVAEHAPA